MGCRTYSGRSVVRTFTSRLAVLFGEAVEPLQVRPLCLSVLPVHRGISTKHCLLPRAQWALASLNCKSKYTRFSFSCLWNTMARSNRKLTMQDSFSMFRGPWFPRSHLSPIQCVPCHGVCATSRSVWHVTEMWGLMLLWLIELDSF